ncbi:MAG: transposase [Anaerolineaceae bacterium]|nr:MAG: transposase [Anaerolineaceae bacterium]
MPYDYRRLSPQEREEIVRLRRERDYPLHAPPHPYREAGYYLLTAANFEHVPVMAAPDRRSEFESGLIKVMKEIKAEIIAWVILPNHYHILVDIESLDLASAALKHLHGSTSRQWNIDDGLTEKRRVWYKFSDRLMRNEKQLHQTFNYIHYNPVKHGCTEDAYEWPWSSLYLYYENNGREWLRERWKSAPPTNDFGRGWDD